METYTTTEIIKILSEKNIILFSLADFGRLFRIENKNTLYKKIQRLEKKEVIGKLKKGQYRFLLNSTNDFALANYLYRPSYISLESALSFYGIITGFPYKITSITPKKSQTYIIDNKEFQYSKMSPFLFWGYEKKGDFLVAEKEKALLDYLYFHLKGLKTLDPKGFELEQIDKKKLLGCARRFENRKLLSIVKEKLL